MEDIYIIGVGMTPWGKYPQKTIIDLGVEAINRALDNAGLKWRQIEGMAASMYQWGGVSGWLTGQNLAITLGETGIPIQNLSNACAVGGASLWSAAAMVRSRECEIAMAVGTDISPDGFLPGISDDPGEPDTLRWMAAGVSNPAFWALECRKRMERFGTTVETLARVKEVTSMHGSMNPNSRFKKAFSVHEVMNSPMVADPLKLLMICATSDGAAAVIVASQSAVRKMGFSKPIKLASVQIASESFGDPGIKIPMLSAPVGDLAPLLSDGVRSSKSAFEQAGLGPEDVDLVELPDNSAWHYLTYLEVMGFCGPGEADHLLNSGQTRLNGRLPVCPSGGASSMGEAVGAQGLAQVCELVNQLREAAGPRQVEDARVGMSQVYGLHGNAASVIVTK